MGQHPSKYPAGVAVQQPVQYAVNPYPSQTAYVQTTSPVPQRPAQYIINGPPGGNFAPPMPRPGLGQLPRRAEVLPPGFDQEMRNMEQDFWNDNAPVIPDKGRPAGPWIPQNPYPPPPGRLPRHRGFAGHMIDNMRQGNFMDGMQPNATQMQPQAVTATAMPNVRTVTTYVDEPRGYVPPNQPNVVVPQPPQSQSIQPTILIYDPSTGQMTQQGGASQATPQVITVPQQQQTPQIITIPQQQSQQAPQIITIPQGTQQQAYTIPQMPAGIPGMPNISWAMPQQQTPQPAPQPIVIPGQYSGAANLYTGYQQ